MRTARIAQAVLLLAVSCGWVGPSLSQAPPSGTGGTPGINVPGQPSFKPPSIPGLPSGVPGSQPTPGTRGTTGTAAPMLQGQDAQWTGKRCLNRAGNSLGTCQDVCRNLGVTRASDATEYSGICNY